MPKTLHILALLCLFMSPPVFGADTSGIPPAGAVPDQETAVAIAVAVFKPIYGAATIARQSPFHADLSGDTWHVYGTLPAGWLGGTAEAKISRKDGRIVKIWHSQ